MICLSLRGILIPMIKNSKCLSVSGVAALMMFATALHAGEEIKHRFLAYDEGRAQLHYVNQHSPDKDWKLQLSKTLRDFQVIGGGKVIVAQPFGYSVYNLATRELVKDVKVPEFDGGISARRRAHGETVLGANVEGGVCVVELDKENKVVRKMTVPGIRTLRMIRLASDGNVLLAEEAGLTEVAFDSQASAMDQPGYVHMGRWRRFLAGALWPRAGWLNREFGCHFVNFISNLIVLSWGYWVAGYVVESSFIRLLAVWIIGLTPIGSALGALVSARLWLLVAKPFGLRVPAALERQQRR